MKIHPFEPHPECPQHRFDSAASEARRLEHQLSHASNVEVFYESINDFMHIEFDYEFPELGKAHCAIRSYKVRSLDVIMPPDNRKLYLWACPYGLETLLDYIKGRCVEDHIREHLTKGTV